jgi:hypothetical protein
VKRLLAFGVPTAVLALAAAGCGSSDSTAGSDTTTPPRELTIEDALVGGAQGPVLVTGYAIPRDGELRLCSAILESYPPQCGEPSLEVRGDVGDDRIGERVSLVGDVEDGVLTVSAATR